MIRDPHARLAHLPGTPEQRTGRLLSFADRMGVDRVVTFMGRPMRARPSPEQSAAILHENAAALLNQG